MIEFRITGKTQAIRLRKAAIIKRLYNGLKHPAERKVFEQMIRVGFTSVEAFRVLYNLRRK